MMINANPFDNVNPYLALVVFCFVSFHVFTGQ